MKIKNIILYSFIALMALFTIIDVVEFKRNISFNETNIIQSIKDLSEKPRSIIHSTNHQTALDYLEDKVESFGIVKSNEVTLPAYQIQKVVTEQKDMYGHDMGELVNGKRSVDEYTIIKEPYDITNLIVNIPANGSKKTNNAVMIMAHYDSVPMGYGASDDVVAVSVMLEAIRFYQEEMKNGLKINNDLVFVFTDGEEYGLFGAYAFSDNYSGFNNVTKRIKFATNLESRGTSGTLIMFETSNNNYNTVKLFSKINKNVFTSSIANMVYQTMPNGTDFSAYKQMYQGINLANLGGGYDYHTQNDNFNNVGMSYTTQQAQFIKSLIDTTCNYDLNKLDEASSDAIFFSYLNIATPYYSYTVAYIFAVMITLMLGVIIYFRVKNKTNIINILKSYLMILAIIISSALVGFIVYYLFNFIAMIFGNIDSHSIGKITYSTPMIVFTLVLIILSIGLITYRLLNKVLKLENEDFNLSVVYFYSFLAIILTFVMPVVSYLFVLPALLMLVLRLVNLKYNVSDLKLELVIFALILPLFYPVVSLATSALGFNMAYAIAALSAIMFLSFIPFIAKANNFIIKVEDKNYKIRKDISLLAIMSIVLIIISASTLGNISTNYQGKQSIYLLPYDDALVYVNNGNDSKYLVRDIDAYAVLGDKLDGYTFDKKLNAYTKNKVENNLNSAGVASINYNNNTITIDRNSFSGYVELVFEGNSNIKSAVCEFANGTKTYDIISNETTLRVRNDVKITIQTNENAEYNGMITAYELLVNYENLLEYKEFENIVLINQAKYNLINVKKIK